MNAAHALLLAGDRASLVDSLAAYDEAIALLRPLAAARAPSTCNSLAAALMNRGEILRRLHGTACFAPAATAFIEAAALFRPLLSAGQPASRRNLVGTLLNHATLILETQPTNPVAADCIEEALGLVRATPKSLTAENTGATESDPALVALAAQLVRLGALSYAAQQPHFLAEFLRENSAFSADVTDAIELAQRRLGERWRVVGTTLPLGRLLAARDELLALRPAAHRLAPFATSVLFA